MSKSKKHQHFNEETMESLRELGGVLRRIHDRLIREGYTIVDGKIIPPQEKQG